MNYVHYVHHPYEISWKHDIEKNAHLAREMCTPSSENACWMHGMVFVHVKKEYATFDKDNCMPLTLCENR